MNDWLLPAAFASIIAIGVTVAIERLGGKKGGLIGTLPTTIVPASIGLHAAAPSLSDFEHAMFITPAGMFVNSLFLFLWRVVPPRLPDWKASSRLAITLVIALIGWAGLAALFVTMAQQIETGHATIAMIVIIVSGATGIWACQRNPPSPKQQRRVGIVTLIARGLLAGAAIGFSVWLGTQGSPLIAGLTAVFPAIYMTTMCSLWLSHGEAASAGAIGPMMLGGTSVSLFAWLAAWAIPAWGIVAGCTLPWLAAVALVTLPAWVWLNRTEPG